MLENIPFLSELVNFAKDLLICNANITFSIPKVCFVVALKSTGV